MTAATGLALPARDTGRPRLRLQSGTLQTQPPGGGGANSLPCDPRSSRSIGPCDPWAALLRSFNRPSVTNPPSMVQPQARLRSIGAGLRTEMSGSVTRFCYDRWQNTRSEGELRMTIPSHCRQPVALMATLVLLSGSAHAQGPAPPAFLNFHLPAEARAADLVHRMTLREKASQLVHWAPAIPRLGVPAYNWWSEALHGVMVNGTTEFPEPIGLAATFDAPGIHRMAADIGIEARVVHEQWLRSGATSASSMYFRGLDFWAPNVNIFRDPRWGRGQETYGEDPFLTARMAVAFVTGIQGSNPRYYLAIATPKHF